MKVTFCTIDGENGLAWIPETHEELRNMLSLYEHEAYCPDCEATVDAGETVCPVCGEGIDAEPEHVPTRKKQD